MRCSDFTFAGFVVAAITAVSASNARGAPPAGDGGVAVKPTAAEKLQARRQARRSEQANTCRVCHESQPDEKLSAPAKQYAESVHRDARIGCVGCHRGDANDPTVRAHATPEFTPRPTGAQIVKICGDCHANARFVRELNSRLQVDQANLFALSLHSKLVHAGDKNAPTCASCHGVHDIAPVSLTTDRVHRRNAAELCGKCHADRELMKPYAVPTDQVAKWKRSKHAEAFAAGNPSAPTCTGCHGPHAGASEVGSTVHVCGGCHKEQLALIQQSPHAKPFEQLGMAECTPCHGHHEVVDISWLAGVSADSACAKCHSRDQKVKRTAQDVAALLREARVAGDEARAELAAAKASGLVILGAAAALDEVRTAELKLRTQVHALDVRQLEQLSKAAKKSARDATQLAVSARQARVQQRRGYYVAIALSAFLFLLLALKVLQLERRRRRSAA